MPPPGSPGFHQHRGCDVDLLDALEAPLASMDGAGLRFSCRAIARWPGIWLRAAEPEFDLVGGGITILDSRTRNAAGDTVVTFTSDHVTFRQSLLVQAPDVERFSSHDRLDATVLACWCSRDWSSPTVAWPRVSTWPPVGWLLQTAVTIG